MLSFSATTPFDAVGEFAAGDGRRDVVGTASGPAAAARPRRDGERPGLYAVLTVLVALAAIAFVCLANRAFAPEMYSPNGIEPVAEALADERNYAVFDLNLNIRELRDEHISRLKRTPEVVVLGASHWQEGHVALLPDKDFYNSHVHRDYWEDMLGVSELFVRHSRLPRQMIITIRDNLFTPIEDRKDFLWEPGIPYYRAMAERLGLETPSWWKTLPFRRASELLSLKMLHDNVSRWMHASDKPHATAERGFETLDTLLPGGSILWSAAHRESFTPERAEREALAFADARRNDPPRIEEKGVEAIDALIGFLKARGVEVFLAHPPFNPLFYDRVKGSPYEAGLREVERRTRELAAAHGLRIIGGFDPAEVGCEADMFIDAEHGNPECLGKVLAQYAAIDAPLALRRTQD